MSYIKREDALDAVLFALVGTGYQSNAIDAIRDVPTADVVEVVRCKDCKWWTKQADSVQGRCALSGHYPTGAWYCANGERSENGKS